MRAVLAGDYFNRGFKGIVKRNVVFIIIDVKSFILLHKKSISKVFDWLADIKSGAGWIFSGMVGDFLRKSGDSVADLIFKLTKRD